MSPGNQPHHLPHHRTLGWQRQSATSPPPESPFRLPWLPLRPHPTLPRDQPFKGCFSSRVAPGAVLSPLTPSPHSLPGQADSGRQQPQPYSYDGQRTKWHTQVRNMVKLPTVLHSMHVFWCRFLFRQAPNKLRLSKTTSSSALPSKCHFYCTGNDGYSGDRYSGNDGYSGLNPPDDAILFTVSGITAIADKKIGDFH